MCKDKKHDSDFFGVLVAQQLAGKKQKLPSLPMLSISVCHVLIAMTLTKAKARRMSAHQAAAL